MGTNDVRKKGLKLCISCRYGWTMLKNIFLVLKSKPEERNNPQTEAGKAIIELAGFLEISGRSPDDIFMITNRFCKESVHNLTEVNIDYSCKENIHTIMRAISNISDINDSKDFKFANSDTYFILSLMLDELEKCLDQDKNGKAYGKKKKNYETYRKNLSRWVNCLKYIEDNNESLKKAENYKVYLSSIVTTYLNEKNIPHYTIKKQGECFDKLFRPIIQNLQEKSKEYTSLQRGIDRLNKEYQGIIRDFIKKSPKMFGVNLCYVMRYKDISEQDINNFTDGKLKASTIQSLKECKIPGISDEQMKLLCRALLVSEDVLYKGHGTSYGNWKTFLEPKTKNAIKYEWEKTAINITGAPIKENDNKKYIYKGIYFLISENEESFQNTLNDLQKDVFVTEQMDIYANEEKEYDASLSKKEISLLLEVLEQKQAQ